MADNYSYLDFEAKQGTAAEFGMSLLASKQERQAKEARKQDRFAKKLLIAQGALGVGKWALDQRAKDFNLSQAGVKNTYLAMMEDTKSAMTMANTINSETYNGNHLNFLVDQYMPQAMKVTEEKYPEKNSEFYKAEARKIAEKFAKENVDKLKTMITNAYKVPTKLEDFEKNWTQVQNYYVPETIGGAIFGNIGRRMKQAATSTTVADARRDVNEIEKLPMFKHLNEFKQSYSVYSALFPGTESLILDEAAKEAPDLYVKQEIKLQQGATETVFNKTTGEYEDITSITPVLIKLKKGAATPTIDLIENKALEEALTFKGISTQMSKVLIDTVNGLGSKLNGKGQQAFKEGLIKLKADPDRHATAWEIKQLSLDIQGVPEYTDLAGISKQAYQNDSDTRVRWWEFLIGKGLADKGVGPDVQPGYGALAPTSYNWKDANKGPSIAKAQGWDYEAWSSDQYDLHTQPVGKDVLAAQKARRIAMPQSVKDIEAANTLWHNSEAYKFLHVRLVNKHHTVLAAAKNFQNPQYMQPALLSELTRNDKGALVSSSTNMVRKGWNLDDPELREVLLKGGWAEYDATSNEFKVKPDIEFILEYYPKTDTFEMQGKTQDEMIELQAALEEEQTRTTQNIEGERSGERVVKGENRITSGGTMVVYNGIEYQIQKGMFGDEYIFTNDGDSVSRKDWGIS